MNKLDRIKEDLKSVPAEPGVYLWKNESGEVIYVGKAKQLRARMRQYVNFQDERAKIPLLVESIDSFEYIVTSNEHESLILEKNLIKEYSPFFNADFKDGKTYPFIALSMSDTFPSIKYTREKHKRDSRYFGPYTDGRAARKVVDTIRRIVPICSASCTEWRYIKRQIEKSEGKDIDGEKIYRRPCFDYHVGLGPGVCCGAISSEDYAKNIKKVIRFLNGNRDEFTQELMNDMQKAAEELDFEKAARIKERIEEIESLDDKQNAVSSHNLNADVIGIYREEKITGVHVFIIREGRIITSNEFILNKGEDVSTEELVRTFIMRYYEMSSSIPHEVVINVEVEDAETIEHWLSEKLSSIHGAKVHLTVPQKGEKSELLKLATRNAKHTLLRYKVRTNYDDKRINNALLQLESALALPKPPYRIECFDISTNHGSYTVASMVVFEGGKPNKKQYRRFKIRAKLDEANDFLSMQEVLRRRYCDEKMKDEKFGKKPDLIILDGGKPQLTAAMQMFEEMGRTDISLCGLAKRDEEIFVPWQDGEPIILPALSESLYLVKQVRDEAHRFAITFHRELRAKAMTSSILDEVDGLGPARKKALLKEFKSFKGVRNASLQDIKDKNILPESVAEELYLVLQQYNNSREKSQKKQDVN